MKYIYVQVKNTRDYYGDKTKVIMQTLRLHQMFPMGQKEKHLNGWQITSDYCKRVDLHKYRYQTFGSTPSTIQSDKTLIRLPCQIKIVLNYILAKLMQRNAVKDKVIPITGLCGPEGG